MLGIRLPAAIGMLALTCLPALANDKVIVAVGQRGYWDTAVAELGKQHGFFQKQGLDLDLLYTQGGGETIQAVISQSVNIGIAAGTTGVFGAFSKGAPIRIIGTQTTGSADYWYVRADSPIKSMTEVPPTATITYSTNGSSSHSEALAFVKTYNLKAKTMASGSPTTTFTQLMSGQLDMGFGSPPFGFADLADQKIRLIGKANDIDRIKTQSIRVIVTNAAFLAQHKDVVARFIDAYRQTLDWMYSDDAALGVFAKFAAIDVSFARKARDEFFPKEMLDPERMSGISTLMEDSISFKVLSQPLDQKQLDELVQIPRRK
jgi:NitT/TauT family transport system substrate-binding protein